MVFFSVRGHLLFSPLVSYAKNENKSPNKRTLSQASFSSDHFIVFKANENQGFIGTNIFFAVNNLYNLFILYSPSTYVGYISWKSVLLFLLNFLYSLSTKENNPRFLVVLLRLEIKLPLRFCILQNLYIGSFHQKRSESVLVRPYKQNLKKMPFCNKTQNLLPFFSFDKEKMINVFINTILP